MPVRRVKQVRAVAAAAAVVGSIWARAMNDPVAVHVAKRPNGLTKQCFEDSHWLGELEHLLQRRVMLVWLGDLNDAVIVDHRSRLLVQRPGELQSSWRSGCGCGVECSLHFAEQRLRDRIGDDRETLILLMCRGAQPAQQQCAVGQSL
eukprot:COSAG06_NODE_10455_length_1679_cov_1.374051_2_plen_148_part_00